MANQVYIGKVLSVSSIPGADNIELLDVGCGAGGIWKGVYQKGSLKVDDLCEVYLQDSVLPREPRFIFMEKHKYRVKMKKFKGAPSEVLIMPLSELTLTHKAGDEISEITKVEKYFKPIPASMIGDVYGDFPGFIPKTDEPNFQSVPQMVEALINKKFYSTLKVDGCSATIYEYDDHFGCCSRNLELKENTENAIWKIARQYDLKNILKNTAVQLELCGPGIQKNPMGLKQVDARLFNVFDIKARSYLDADKTREYSRYMPLVDIIDWDIYFTDHYSKNLQLYAEKLYPNKTPAEGLVIRPMQEMRVDGDRLSFKVINLEY